MIKGLYFKLNMEKETDKFIFDVFEKESKRTGLTKLTLLTMMIELYKSSPLAGVKQWLTIYGYVCY